MTIPLKLRTDGDLERFAAADVLDVDTIEPRSAGHLIIGATLGAGDEVRLGVWGQNVRVMGDLIVDGSSTITTDETVTGTFNANGNVNLGNNSGDTINLGGGTTDVLNVDTHMVFGAGTIRLGASVTDYILDLWLDAADAVGPALAAYNLNENGTNAGAYAIGVDAALIANSAATNLMTMLDDLDAAIAGASTLQASYAAGNTIDVTLAEGIIDFANDTATDTTTVLSVSRAPASGTAGTGIDVNLGTNTTGVAVLINQQGTGAAIQVQDGGTNVFEVTGAGAVNFDPTSGQNFDVTALGAGTVGLNSATGAITLTSTGAAVNISAAAASSIATSAGNLTLDSAAGELVFDDVGNSGLELSQAADRTLSQTAATEILNGATSLVGAINRLARHIDADGGGPIQSIPIENTIIIAADDVVARSSVTGRCTLWDGNAAANTKFLGIALTGGTGDVGGTVEARVAFPGNVVTDTGATFTIGAALFGPDGTGSVTETAPAGDGDAIKRIGWAATATDYIVEPGPTVVNRI